MNRSHADRRTPSHVLDACIRACMLEVFLTRVPLAWKHHRPANDRSRLQLLQPLDNGSLGSALKDIRRNAR